MQVTYLAGGALVAIDFDGAIRENHVATSTITEHAVEKGANVSDHVRPDLKKFTVDAIVTNTPISAPTSNASGVKGDVRGKALTIPITQRPFTTKELTFPERVNLPIGIPGVGAALAGLGALDTTGTRKISTLDRSADATRTVNASVLQFDGEFDRVGDVFHELDTLRETATIVTVVTTLRIYENMVIQSISAPRTAADGSAITFALNFQEIRFAETRTVKAPADKKKPVAKSDLGPKSGQPVKLKSVAAGLVDGDAAKAFNGMVHH